MEDSVGFQVCDPELLGIVEDTASFDANCAGSSANWLGSPVSCVLALDLGLTIQNIMLIAAVLNLLLVAVLSHHSEGDEAIWYGCWDGTAHLSAHRWLRCTSISHAGSPLITWCLRWFTLICPALPIHGSASINRLIMGDSSIYRWPGQLAVHNFAERWWIAPGAIMQTAALIVSLHDIPVITCVVKHTLVWSFSHPH